MRSFLSVAGLCVALLETLLRLADVVLMAKHTLVPQQDVTLCNLNTLNVL